MKIIPATLNHLDEVIHVNNFVDYENPDSFMKESIQWGRVFVALEWEQVVGFLLYQVIWWNTLFIALIKIHPNFQQQGIGSKLIKFFGERMKQEGYTGYISSTGDDNPWSQIFHQKVWLSHIGTLEMSFGGEVFYRKDL